MDRKSLAILPVAAIIGVAIYTGANAEGVLDTVQGYYGSLHAAYHDNPALIIAGYFLLMTLAVSLMLPVTMVMMLVGGALFSWPLALLLSVAALTIGSVNIFLMSRHYFSDSVQRRFEEKFNKINNALEENSAFYLLLMRLSPGVPTYLIAVLMSLSPISVKTFAWVTGVGVIPWTAVYVAAGEGLTYIRSVDDIISPEMTYTFAGVAAFMLLAYTLMTQWGKADAMRKLIPLKE